jgi:hypothetical protein
MRPAAQTERRDQVRSETTITKYHDDKTLTRGPALVARCHAAFPHCLVP